VKDPLAEALTRREAGRRALRATWEGLWKSVEQYVVPQSSTFVETVTPGIERNRDVLDSTAPRALELFASFLHTLLNNPAQQWFRIGIKNRPDLDDAVDVKQWREAVAKIMLTEMSSERANLYQHLHTTYLDLGAYGTAILYTEFRNGRLLTRSYHLYDCVVEEDNEGFVDTMYRQEKLTARQADQRWPDGAGVSIARELKGKAPATTAFRFLHCVVPVSDREIGPLLPQKVKQSGAPFASIWVNTQDQHTVATGTYEEFPYAVPRWMRMRGEVYGRSPGITVLPDVRMANRMKGTILRGAEKLVDPPLHMPDGGLVSPVRLHPGGLTFTEGSIDIKPLIPPGASRIEMGNQLLEQVQRDIERGFFVQLFQTPDTPVKTATQVLQEVDERNRAVSPMLIRVQSELFHPLILRVFNLLTRAKLLPEPPESIRGEAPTVEYISPLTGSQRQIEGLATSRLFELLAPWAQVDPGVFDLFDPDEVARTAHAASGAPAKQLRTAQKVKVLRQARAQQQEQAAQQQQAVEGGKTAAALIAATNKGRA